MSTTSTTSAPEGAARIIAALVLAAAVAGCALVGALADGSSDAASPVIGGGPAPGAGGFGGSGGSDGSGNDGGTATTKAAFPLPSGARPDKSRETVGTEEAYEVPGGRLGDVKRFYNDAFDALGWVWSDQVGSSLTNDQGKRVLSWTGDVTDGDQRVGYLSIDDDLLSDKGRITIDWTPV